MMAVRLVAAAVCLAALASGCIIREIREIHHAPPGESARSACAQCEGSAAPGSMMADSQPPSPMVEEAGLPPGEGYVWVDGYWHWDGAEWIWISGRWVPPMNDFYFVAPAYYASGSDCVYVPGYWQRGPRSPYPIRDRRVISGHHSRGKGSYRPGRHTHRPGIGDHRGDKPTSPPGSHGGKRDGDAIVVEVPASPRPEKVGPSSPSAAPPTSPAWRSPTVSAAPPSAPRGPSAGPPVQARPPAPSSPPPRAAPPPSPARVAHPGPSRAAPPSSSPPPRAAPPSPPARSSPPPAKSSPPPSHGGGGGSKKK